MSDFGNYFSLLNESSHEVSHIQVRPAEFSEASASAWFAILEAQFELARITQSSTKFFNALSVLPASLINRLSPDVIANKNFHELKSEILALVERTKPELFESLLAAESLTGRPSACLSKLLQTAAQTGVGEDFVRHKFIQLLPANIAPIIASKHSMKIKEIGALADELISFNNNRESCCSINTQQKHEDRPQQYQQQHQHQPHGHQSRHHQYEHWQQQQASIQCHPSVRPFHNNQRALMCRAHIYYGANARTCRHWCQYPNKSGVKMEPNSRPASPSPKLNSSN